MVLKINKEFPMIAIITLNRPEKRNALNIDLLKKLCQTLEDINNDPKIRVVILEGEGKVFCSGLDLEAVTELARNEEATSLVMKLLTTIYKGRMITIAAVHGAAMAAGAGILSACDFAVAAENTKFGFPETKRGIVPALVMSFLVRQIPYRMVREFLLLGEIFDTKRALACGFITRIVPEGEQRKEALKIAEIIIKGAPQAIVKTKQLLEDIYPRPIVEDNKKTLTCLQSAIESTEAQEGIKAFLEKREPRWNT